MPIFNTINSLTTTSSSNGQDVTQPFSYQEWIARNSNIPATETYAQYNLYVQNWYINSAIANTAGVNAVQNYYKAFLKSLGVTARNNYESELFNNVNFDDPLSIQSAITGYARKLKDIAIYLANTRNHLTYTKLKNNLTGTTLSLERLFYNFLLTSFTRKTTPDGLITSFVVTDPNILQYLPYLTTIAPVFNIEIQELYDTNEYYDLQLTDVASVSGTVSIGTNIAVPADVYNSGQYDIPIDYLIASVISSVATTNILSMATTLPTYFTFIGDNRTTTFALSNITSSTASDYQVTIDGIVQTPDSSYSVSAQNQTITFSAPPPINTTIVIVIR
jgi:hypothetical protein